MAADLAIRPPSLEEVTDRLHRLRKGADERFRRLDHEWKLAYGAAQKSGAPLAMKRRAQSLARRLCDHIRKHAELNKEVRRWDAFMAQPRVAMPMVRRVTRMRTRRCVRSSRRAVHVARVAAKTTSTGDPDSESDSSRALRSSAGGAA